MSNSEKINYVDLIDIVKKSNSPFSRENVFGKIKSNLGSGYFIWNDLGNGIACSATNYKVFQNKSVFISSNIAGAVLIFNLANDIKYTYKDGKKFNLKKNSFIIGFSSDSFYADFNLEKNKQYNTLTIGIKEELFLQLAHNLESMKNKMNSVKKSSYNLLDGGEIDPEQKEILLAFKEDTLNENLLNNLYLESKITSLTHYTIEKVVNDLNKDNSIDENILKSLKKAKSIITENYASSPTIKEIAYKSAINECYLKKDFKRYYGMTVHEMIQKHKLEAAKKLLKKNISVKEVALKIGYKHTGHFSKLFTQYFNISPSTYRKKFN